MRKTHSSKGHQNEKGRVIGAGPYRSNFSVGEHGEKWIHSIQLHLNYLQKELQSRYNSSASAVTDLGKARTLHKEVISGFFVQVGSAPCYISHITCFCCLKEVPQYGLPCGHVLCSACIRAYSEDQNDGHLVLKSCPLHYRDSFHDRWRIWMKPEYAGVRVLSLDG